MWYDIDNTDNDIVISSRVRLARNLRKYPFSMKINSNQVLDMIKDVKNAVIDNYSASNQKFKYIDLKNLTDVGKISMAENHIISTDFLKNTQPTALLLNENETLSIMINEEDHIRIQAVLAGNSMDKVWTLTDEADNLLEQSLEYAYDSEYGYLTSCPTNVGTGMRASYMIHIPLVELTGQIKHIMQFISKFGMTVRGIYGEGSDTQGGIYQISNQITLGQSEEDIISNMKAVTNQVIEQELKLREKLISENYSTLEDQVYRAYGLVTNARIISLNEAMKDLSYVRLGYATGVLKEDKPLSNIHSIMINIQPANLLRYYNKNLEENQKDIARAEFIRNQFQK